MSSLFNYDNPIFQALGRITDIVLLNFLCIFCCIPIITIGPAITALYYCMLKISREQDTSMVRMFFHSFRDNFKQGTLMTLIFFVCAVFLLIDLHVCNVLALPVLKIIRILIYTLALILIVVVSYSFPLLAQFENTIRNTLKNSLFMAISNFFYTILIVFLNILPFLIFYLLPDFFVLILPVLIICGTALTAFINSRLFVKIFDPYIS